MVQSQVVVLSHGVSENYHRIDELVEIVMIRERDAMSFEPEEYHGFPQT